MIELVFCNYTNHVMMIDFRMKDSSENPLWNEVEQRL
jgi:hypothetical protein